MIDDKAGTRVFQSFLKLRRIEDVFKNVAYVLTRRKS